MITEDQLEKICLGWFREICYEIAFGPDIAHDGEMPERVDYQQVVLTDRLLSAMQTINPRVPTPVLEEAVLNGIKPESPILIHNNRIFHRLLLEGVPVAYSDGDDTRHDHVQLIDFNNFRNNQFLVVNQFTIQGTRMNRRPDVVVFVNGLPIAVIELKNPSNEQTDVWDAFNQLQTYKEEISDLFVFNEALVVSDGWTARIGFLTANKERFMPWRTLKHEDDKPLLEYELEKMVKGFFDPELLLDYIRYFIIFEQEGDAVIKKIAGYHQFHAVRVTVIASKQPEDGQIAENRAGYGQAAGMICGRCWQHGRRAASSLPQCRSFLC